MNNKDCCSKNCCVVAFQSQEFKTSRRSRHGQPFSPYDDEDEGGGADVFDWDGEDDSFSDDEFGEDKILKQIRDG